MFWGIMNRRDVLLTGGVGLVSGLAIPSLTHATESKAKDARVAFFMEFINNYKQVGKNSFPGKDYFQNYVSRDFSYVTSAGQRLDVDQLILRVKTYAGSFGTANASLKSASLREDEIWLITTLTPHVFSNEFVGFPPTNQSANIEAIWEVSFDSNGKIDSLRRHGDYKTLAEIVETNNLCRLHQLD